MKKHYLKKAFTLLELIIIMAIITMAASLNFAMHRYLLADTLLDIKTHEIIETLKLTQIRSITGYKNSPWGIYFKKTNGGTDQYIIFKGTSYNSRDTAYDLASDLPASISFNTITLTGGGTEIIFTKTTGKTSQAGSIQIKNNQNSIRTITINGQGALDIN